MERWMKLLMFALIGVVIGPSLVVGTCFAASTEFDAAQPSTDTYFSCDSHELASFNVPMTIYPQTDQVGKVVLSDLLMPLQPDVSPSLIPLSVTKPDGPTANLQTEPPQQFS